MFSVNGMTVRCWVGTLFCLMNRALWPSQSPDINPTEMQANMQNAQLMLADQILTVEQTNSDFLFTVLEAFNKGNLGHSLNAWPGRRIFWIVATQQSILSITPSPALHWAALNTPWSTWFLRTGIDYSWLTCTGDLRSEAVMVQWTFKCAWTVQPGICSGLLLIVWMSTQSLWCPTSAEVGTGAGAGL